MAREFTKNSAFQRFNQGSQHYKKNHSPQKKIRSASQNTILCISAQNIKS